MSKAGMSKDVACAEVTLKAGVIKICFQYEEKNGINLITSKGSNSLWNNGHPNPTNFT